ncbi:hypothetical protein GW7_19576 [Heterocephalus glaber]|uniref:Uncharacterized protein n=1 Tax=Heterocephalus glaber TaxID=10181 RepID=G5AZV8_HETGA|nr:hypothetical protein GW7_19576 [Heterocephalus glaber]
MAATTEAWATALEALVAGASAVAVDVAASTDWAGAEATDLALALDTTDMAAAAHCTMEDMESLDSTKQFADVQILSTMFLIMCFSNAVSFPDGDNVSIICCLQAPEETSHQFLQKNLKLFH